MLTFSIHKSVGLYAWMELEKKFRPVKHHYCGRVFVLGCECPPYTNITCRIR